VVHFLDETGSQELVDLLAYSLVPLIIEAAQVLVHGFGTRLDAKLMLGDLEWNA
jgi:hypothetical protein